MEEEANPTPAALEVDDQRRSTASMGQVAHGVRTLYRTERLSKIRTIRQSGGTEFRPHHFVTEFLGYSDELVDVSSPESSLERVKGQVSVYGEHTQSQVRATRPLANVCAPRLLWYPATRAPFQCTADTLPVGCLDDIAEDESEVPDQIRIGQGDCAWQQTGG